jgi:hypothetical protein
MADLGSASADGAAAVQLVSQTAPDFTLINANGPPQAIR